MQREHALRLCPRLGLGYFQGRARTGYLCHASATLFEGGSRPASPSLASPFNLSTKSARGGRIPRDPVLSRWGHRAIAMNESIFVSSLSGVILATMLPALFLLTLGWIMDRFGLCGPQAFFRSIQARHSHRRL